MKKKKILIVNCYFDELRIPIRRKTKVPQAMSPVFLAGVFSPDLCEIKLYNEQYSGPLESEALLSWPDMLVLTGLNTAFDRMLHLTAYARTKNRSVIVVAGGPAIRALFHYSKAFFNYSCIGDIELTAEVIEDSFGKDYVSRDFLEKSWVLPRYDLAYWMGNIAYVESSRNCYNNCNFCSLTAEGSHYQAYDLEYLRQQFMALGKRKIVMFIDNNFGGTDKCFLSERFELTKELWKKKLFWRWCALVSGDFFLKEENINLASDSGCVSLFSGIESFDRQALLSFKKYQNTLIPQVETIRKCLETGITFYYGLVFDVASRTIANLREELEFIIGNPEITLPCYISLAVPMLGTPFFYECLAQKKILPNTKIRDLDSTTITLKPLDEMSIVVQFVKDLQNLSGYRQKVIRHGINFFRLYRKSLSFWNMELALHAELLLCTPKLSTAVSDIGGIFINNFKKRSRTFIASTEPLDNVYKPAFHVNSNYENYFKPTMLTDHEGNLSDALHADLLRFRS
jgi:hopanoid C-2 methylase